MSDLPSPEPLEEGLSQLAPEVDLDAAQRSFMKQRRRWTLVRRARVGGASIVVVFAAVLLAGVVLNGGDGTSVTAGQPDGSTAERSNVFPLPAPGHATSVLLDDGTPIWVVNHGDGTASAVPAMFSVGRMASTGDGQLLDIVTWDPDGAFDVFVPSDDEGQALSWDSHGRAITADADLGGLLATIDGSHAIVERTGTTDVPGEPERATRSDRGVEAPRLPPVASAEGLSPGWHQVEADIVIDRDGTARLCERIRDDRPVAGTGESACLETATVNSINVRPDTTMRLMSPLVIRVNEAMIIDAVYAIGGMVTATEHGE